MQEWDCFRKVQCRAYLEVNPCYGLAPTECLVLGAMLE